MESKGETLKRLRCGMGMTQEVLSKLSGVSQTSISRIERGAVTPYWRTLWRLADALDTFDCEGAVDLLDGDWRLPRRKYLNFSQVHFAHSPYRSGAPAVLATQLPGGSP